MVSASHASAPPLDANDPVSLDASLSEEERTLRDSVRRFVREEVLPGIGGHFESGTFDTELPKKLGTMGLLGMHLQGYGCGGASAVAYGLVCAELECADSGVRSFASVQGSLAMFAIHHFGSEEQKQRYLPGMAAGEVIGCFGLTEPDSGSDPASMRTRARRDGGDWVLDGTKLWITNGHIADVAVVWARTDEGTRGFLIDRGTPGFSAQPIGHKMSLRASATSELVLRNCRVSDAARLPEAHGLRAPLSCLDEARYGILWGVTGAARACYLAALDYAGQRDQFGGPISRFQLTQRKLVDLALSVGESQLLALHLGRVKDATGLSSDHVSLGKLTNCRKALEVARTARSILGANGISLEYPVIRHMLNLESVFTYEGTDEIHTLVVGRALTGHAAFA